MREHALVPALLATLLFASPALAEPTSWLALGAGASLQRDRPTATRDGAAAFTYSVGVGTSPLAPVVVGGVFRGTTLVNFGTDVGAALRLATGGFARGEWGLALDAGALWRSWGAGTHGDWPLQFVVTGGAPWGLQIALGTQLGTLSGGTAAQGFFAALEVDLLRLSIMRQGPTEQWWPNPNPAGGRVAGR